MGVLKLESLFTQILLDRAVYVWIFCLVKMGPTFRVFLVVSVSCHGSGELV